MTGATVDELRERLEDITAQRREHERRAVELATWEASVRAELDHYAAAEMALRPLGAAATPRRTRTRATAIPLERTRDAVVALGRFSVSELSAELGCSPAQARRELARPEIARMVERVEGRERYGYVAPTDPGEAFKAQRRLRVVEPEMPRGREGGEIAQTLLGSIPDKEIKKVVQAAVRDGWQLVHSGGKHPLRLERNGAVVGFATSPTNSDHAARAIRRQLRAAS